MEYARRCFRFQVVGKIERGDSDAQRKDESEQVRLSLAIALDSKLAGRSVASGVATTTAALLAMFDAGMWM